MCCLSANERHTADSRRTVTSNEKYEPLDPHHSDAAESDALLTLMKSQPLAYNKDNQEDKEPLFDTVDTVLDSLRAFADMVPAIRPRKDRMREAARSGFSTATDLADYLVGLGLPFRDAHEVVGKAVAHGVESGTDLADMDLATLQGFCADIREDVFEVIAREQA